MGRRRKNQQSPQVPPTGSNVTSTTDIAGALAQIEATKSTEVPVSKTDENKSENASKDLVSMTGHARDQLANEADTIKRLANSPVMNTAIVKNITGRCEILAKSLRELK